MTRLFFFIAMRLSRYHRQCFLRGPQSAGQAFSTCRIALRWDLVMLCRHRPHSKGAGSSSPSMPWAPGRKHGKFSWTPTVLPTQRGSRQDGPPMPAPMAPGQPRGVANCARNAGATTGNGTTAPPPMPSGRCTATVDGAHAEASKVGLRARPLSNEEPPRRRPENKAPAAAMCSAQACASARARSPLCNARGRVHARAPLGQGASEPMA
mmetsp:Transcript_53351/g.152969  ORF Transcript_53351/g.152969 Transcript_53351/m.152969 type:complete len:209 (+) Transcript_53351:172-798(+)